MAAGVPNLHFQTYPDHFLLVLKPGMTEARWADVEQVSTAVVQQLEAASGPRLVVDLTELNYISSAMVALLVRIWKVVNSRDGQMVVVNQSQVITEVLKIAGLLSLWDVVPVRPAAMHRLGVSARARSHKRASRILLGLSVVLAFASLGGLVAWRMEWDQLPQTAWQVLVLGGGGLAALLGLVSCCREGNRSRRWAVLSVVLGVGVVLVHVFRIEPNFSALIPTRRELPTPKPIPDEAIPVSTDTPLVNRGATPSIHDEDRPPAHAESYHRPIVEP